MPRSKKGKGPKKKPKMLYSGKKLCWGHWRRGNNCRKICSRIWNKSEDKALKTQEEAGFQMVNKVTLPLGQFDLILNMPLVWFVETTDCNMMKKQSFSVRLQADLIEKMMGNPTKSSKSFDSQTNASKARKELHPLIITKIIANIESLSFKEESEVKNIPDVIY